MGFNSFEPSTSLTTSNIGNGTHQDIQIRLPNSQIQRITILNQDGQTIGVLKLSNSNIIDSIKYVKHTLPSEQQQSSVGPQHHSTPISNLSMEIETSELVNFFYKSQDKNQFLFKGLINSYGKEENTNEDSFFLAKDLRSIGVADGVGSWKFHGVDSGNYSRGLMEYISNLTNNSPWLKPYELIDEAYKNNTNLKIQGSSTICILKAIGSKVYSGLIGDSSYLIIRNNKIIFRSTEQTHKFNHPFQLGLQSEDLPSSGIYMEHDCKDNDIFLIGTDGFFDNLFDNEILESMKKVSSIESFYYYLVDLAKSKSKDHKASTPYSSKLNTIGGKIDDITLGCFIFSNFS